MPVSPERRGNPNQSTPALSLRNLTKRFGQKIAVDNLSLDVPRGSFYGVVGPNGAGKTTSLSMATGLLRPDAGTASILGADVWRDPDAAKHLLGVLNDGVRLFTRLSGFELVLYSGLLRGIDRPVAEQRARELLAALDLEDASNKLVVDYSAGMTKKIALASALVHAPRVLLLDEPFEAVDPVSAATIQAILRDYVSSGATVVISSHVMELVERLCDHVAIVNDGRVIRAGTVDEVRAGKSLQDRFVEAVGARAVSTEGLQWLRNS